MSVAWLICLLGLSAGPSEANVVLVTVDTLRADRLGVYGCSRPTSPFLDELARESVVFERMYAQSSFTPPSHASILTSLYVRQHGVLTWNKLAEEHVTLAEVLSEAGYATGAFINIGLLTMNNLGQGYGARAQVGTPNFDSERVNELALKWLRDHRSGKFHLWLHYYDVHAPYARHKEYERLFNKTHDVTVGRHGGFYNLDPEQRQELGLTEADTRFIKDRYDAGVVHADRAVRALVDGLKELGVWDNTLFVLTSDHGEAFDEHYWMYFAHDPFLFDEVVRVPALVRFPKGRHGGARCQAMVESIDLAPTILNYLSIPCPDQFEGRDLLGVLEGGSGGRREVFSECWGWRVKKSIRTEKWKLIWKVRDGTTELFDLEKDPGEQTNVAGVHLEVRNRLYERLTRWAGADSGRVEENPQLHDETLSRIRALGYARGGGVDDQ